MNSSIYFNFENIKQIKKEIKQFLQDVEVELDDKYLDDLIKTNTSEKTTINKLDSITNINLYNSN